MPSFPTDIVFAGDDRARDHAQPAGRCQNGTNRASGPDRLVSTAQSGTGQTRLSSRPLYRIFHITNEGKFSILRTGLGGKYAEMPCVGGYIDGGDEKLTPGTQNIIAGKDRSWGNKRIAYFQTSDSRRADHRDLGRVSTWVKWATPTAEALR